MSYRVRFLVLIFAVSTVLYGSAARAAIKNFTITPTAVIGGATVTGTISLTEATQAKNSVTAQLSSNSSFAEVNDSVTFFGGSLSKTFEIRTKAVTASRTVVIAVSIDGIERTASLAIAPPTLSTMTLAASDILGGGAVTGTVTLTGPAGPTSNGNGINGFLVPLSSSDSAAEVTSRVIVPTGQLTATFPIETTRVTSVKTATITAGNKTANLSIKPLIVSALTLSASEAIGGGAVTGTISITDPTASTRGFTVPVVLSSSNTSSATVPAQILIPARQTSATFPVTTFPVNGQTAATISADPLANNRTAQLTVNPAELASVTLILPQGIDATGSRFAGGGTITNHSSPALDIRFTGLVPQDSIVTLQSTSPAVIIQATRNIGGRATNGVLVTFSTQAVAVDTAVTVKVTAPSGRSSMGVDFELIPPVAKTLLVGTTAAPFIGGNRLPNWSVRLNAKAPAGGIRIPLSSSMTGAVPDFVEVAAGAQAGVFSILPTPVSSATTLTISSEKRAFGTLTISPPGLASLVLASPTIAGGTSTRASIILNGAAPDGGFNVSLTSGNTFAGTVPATLTIGAGLTAGSFDINTNPVQTDTIVTVTGRAGGTSQVANLVVQAGR